MEDQYQARILEARAFWESRKTVGFLYQGERAQFHRESERSEDEYLEPEVKIRNLDKYQPLNDHLGKAGGLNFCLQASMYVCYEDRLPPMSPTHPLFFGIIDARHSCDERFWTKVMPAFFEASEKRGVTFEPDVCLVQLAHAYIGTQEHKNDALDMGNNFLFTGMAVIRDTCYGMTSCGTGGTWAIMTTEDPGHTFYGRTMIEDSASSLEMFLKGLRSVYVPPLRNKPPHEQLMCAVPKVSANYLEALERWDTGAVQCFCAQAVGRPWFWLMSTWMLTLMASMIAPSWISLKDVDSFADIPKYVLDFQAHPGVFVSALCFAFWIICLFAGAILMYTSISTLNFILRLTILFFNVTYPFNSFSSIFWIIIPPWICLTGKFPFSFQPVFAIAGSLALRIIEWLIVIKVKSESERYGTQLREYSIFRSQQMNEVTVPLKVRAVFKGLATGYEDVVQKKDNSFWVSFGTAAAVQWVQVWLCAAVATMFASILGAIINMIIDPVQDTYIACVFGLVLAVIQIWILWEPTFFVMRGRTMKMSMRHTEILILLAIGMAFVMLSGSTAFVHLSAFGGR